MVARPLSDTHLKTVFFKKTKISLKVKIDLYQKWRKFKFHKLENKCAKIWAVAAQPGEQGQQLLPLISEIVT